MLEGIGNMPSTGSKDSIVLFHDHNVRVFVRILQIASREQKPCRLAAALLCRNAFLELCFASVVAQSWKRYPCNPRELLEL